MRRSDESVPFSAKLNDLFAKKRHANGAEFSNEHVAAEIGEQGVTISQSYIWQLRKSKKDNPTLKHLQALADFFEVPVAYFFDDEVADVVNQQLDGIRSDEERLNEMVGGDDILVMAMRAGELSEQGRKQVIDLVNMVHRLERGK
ncbi:MAG TPA: helix-turn-helix domain-containing protein [Actinokineospora sp.]|nr:helix-turn-helix domain-containing protein [Actinokineospora sp.]